MSRVLVVDPSEMCELLTTLLQQYGIDAVGAATGEEALARSLEQPPSVVIVEHVLADARGIDVAELLRSELSATAALIYTHTDTDRDPQLLERLLQLDASFVRPFRSLDVVEFVAHSLGLALDAKSGIRSVEAPAQLTPGFGLLGSAGDFVDDDETTLTLRNRPLLEAAFASANERSLATEGDFSGDGVEAVTLLVSASHFPTAPLRTVPTTSYAPGALLEVWERMKSRRSDERGPVLPGREGELTPRALTEVLDAFHQSKTTGELWIENGTLQRALYFRRGVVTNGRSNLDGEDVVSLAVRRAMMDRSTAADIKDAMRSGAFKNVTHAILACDALEETDLETLVAENARDIATHAYLWGGGRYRIGFEARAASEPIQANICVADLVVRGVLASETDAALADAVPDDARFGPTLDASYRIEDVLLPDAVSAFVREMDGSKTIRDLRHLHDTVNERTARGTVAALVALGLVRFFGMGDSAPRRIAFF